MMRPLSIQPLGLASLLLVLATAVACGSSVPSTDAARQALRSTIDKGKEDRLRVVSIQKTDGRAMEFMGMKAYELMFAADAEFVSKAMFSIGSPLVSEGTEITTIEYREPSAGFSWDDFLSGSQGFRPAMKGDRLHLTGSVTFERRESGWTAVGVKFAFKHDSSTRDMDAVRVEAERREVEYLSRVAEEINRSVPVMIDQEIELMSAVGAPGMLIYNYRLISYSVTKLDHKTFAAGAKQKVTQGACGRPETRDDFLKKGVTLRYSYFDKDKQHIATVNVTPSDCGF